MGGAAGRRTTVVAALGCLVLTSACAATVEPASPRTPAAVGSAWPGCERIGAFADDRGQGPSGRGGVPAGFEPTAVVLCDTEDRPVATGTDRTVELERTSTEVAPLVTYLRQPDGPPTQEACTADGWVPPWLFLLDAQGRYVAPAIPVDGCSKPLGWDRRDGPGLAWATLPYSDRVLGPARDLAGQLGCPSTQPDLVDTYAATRRRDRTFDRDPFDGRAVRLCVYDAPVGTFVTGQSLLPEEHTAFVAALTSSPAAAPRCSERSDQFGLLSDRDGGRRLFLELKGCRRVVSDERTSPVVRADDDLLTLFGG